MTWNICLWQNLNNCVIMGRKLITEQGYDVYEKDIDC